MLTILMKRLLCVFIFFAVIYCALTSFTGQSEETYTTGIIDLPTYSSLPEPSSLPDIILPAPSLSLPATINHSQFHKPLIDWVHIDISIIAVIESGNNPKAQNHDGTCLGLCQIAPETWKQETKIIFGHSLPLSSIYNKSLNKRVANHYYNTTIPSYLEEYNIPITYETIIACYNYGIGNVNRLYKSYGTNWKKHLPKETANYIISYKNLREERL